jgi:hypothetical protein
MAAERKQLPEIPPPEIPQRVIHQHFENPAKAPRRQSIGKIDSFTCWETRVDWRGGVA